MNIKEIIQRLRTAMDDARGEESHFQSWLIQNEGICDAIDALKELDKPEQEPRNIRERWNIEFDGDDLLVCFNDHEKSEGCRYERYVLATTTPPQRKPLTDEEIDRIWGSHTFIQATDRRQQAFARAIEAAHGIKGEA